jgi:HSP20 family molecular chaperone IbpA
VTIVKTELPGMEDHRKAVQEDIARRAYALYEADDFEDGLDLDHWFRAERELSVPDVPLSVEKDAVTVRIAMEQFSGSPLVISVSHRSLLILGVTEDESGNAIEGADRDILRFVSLPVDIDPAQATCELFYGTTAVVIQLDSPSLTKVRDPCAAIGTEPAPRSIVSPTVGATRRPAPPATSATTSSWPPE